MLRTVLIVVVAVVVASFVLSILWSLVKGLFALTVVAAFAIGAIMLATRLTKLVQRSARRS